MHVVLFFDVANDGRAVAEVAVAIRAGGHAYYYSMCLVFSVWLCCNNPSLVFYVMEPIDGSSRPTCLKQNRDVIRSVRTTNAWFAFGVE